MHAAAMATLGSTSLINKYDLYQGIKSSAAAQWQPVYSIY
jgi:hypothetical protein